MRLHVVLPNESTAMEPGQLLDLAQQAARLGFDTAWLPDHVLPPKPYGTTFGGVYEPLVTLAAIAATTGTIRLGTSVLILPLRNPFVLAKQVATLDRISGSRVVLGVGIGWDRQEFASVGADFTTRGAQADEAIDLLRHLWSSTPDAATTFDGERYRFADGVFAPRPNEGTVPLMVGGTSDAALRRAARVADMWQAVGIGPKEFASRRNQLRAAAARPIEAGARTLWTGADRPLADIVAEAEQWREVGADHLSVWFGAAEGFGDRMERFMAEVEPR
jgi:probable F420-dependent oxidoreductase